MQLFNETPYPARLLGVDRHGDSNVSAIVVVKATFERGEGARWAPAREQLPLVEDRLDTPFGLFHTDCFAAKDGVDVCVLGTVRVQRPTRVHTLSISIESLENTLRVSGDRRWVRQGAGLVPSDPIPFVEMPLSYTRAYGGVTQHEYESVSWPDNPLGIGYYLSESEATDQPLPNVEAAEAAPLSTWSDQAPVAGWAPYPLFWGLRAREGVEAGTGPAGKIFPRIKARLNNHAHPRLVLPILREGALIRIRGMRDRELALEAPSLQPVVRVEVEGVHTEARGRLDGVFLWIDAERVTLTYRIPFQYTFIKGQVRSARLFDTLAQPGGRSWLA